MKKIVAILVSLSLITVLAACQTDRDQPVAGTVIRVDGLLADFNRYYEAISSNADIEVVEAAAGRIMSRLRNDFPTDWLTALHMRERSRQDIDELLILIGSRVAAARSIGDDRFEEALMDAANSSLNEDQERIWQLILSSIEYFENQ